MSLSHHLNRDFLRKVFVLFGLFILISACADPQRQREPETYSLPDGYVGSFYVIYKVPNGEPKKIVNGARAFDIPADGVLLTQSDLNPGWIDTDKIKFYYRKKSGELQEIKERWTGSVADTKENRADKRVMIFGGGVGTFQKTADSCYITHKEFHVGTKKDILDGVHHFDLSAIPDLDKKVCEHK